MAKNSTWHDDYWLLLMQIYLKKPVGVKALYNRDMVNLSLELHIAPEALQSRMQQIARLETPRIERIWQTYHNDTRKLKRAVSMLRKMSGFGTAGLFYDGVEVEETFEKDFRPLPEDERLTPVMLILILNLYFQLTPSTMTADTPEVRSLSRLIKLPITDIVNLLEIYQNCDPYLKRNDSSSHPLMQPCQQIWQRFGNIDTTFLEKYADEIREYFKK